MASPFRHKEITMSRVMNTNREFVNVDGHFVRKDVLGIVDRIRAYDPSLDILYLDPSRTQGAVNEAPYIVVELCKDGQYRRVFEVWELNETVLERIEAADTARHDLMAIMDGRMVEFKNQREQRFQEKLLEGSDVMKHLLKSPKTTYSFPNSDGQVVKVDDKFGVTHRDGKRVDRG